MRRADALRTDLIGWRWTASVLLKTLAIINTTWDECTNKCLRCVSVEWTSDWAKLPKLVKHLPARCLMWRANFSSLSMTTHTCYFRSYVDGSSSQSDGLELNLDKLLSDAQPYKPRLIRVSFKASTGLSGKTVSPSRTWIHRSSFNITPEAGSAGWLSKKRENLLSLS